MLVLRALDTTIATTCDDPSLIASVDVITAAYFRESADAPELLYAFDAQRGELRCNGELIAEACPAIDLPMLFERDLYLRLAARTRGGLLLHAAAVSDGGSALLLFGSSGCGKTTMTRALLADGAEYITDETSWIVSGQVRGLPRPLAIGRAAQHDDGPDIGAIAGAEERSQTFRVRDGLLAQRVVIPPQSIVVHDPRPVSALIHLRHNLAEPPGARPMPASEVLLALWAQNRRGDANGWSTAVDIAADLPVYELVTHDVPGAILAVESIWRAHRRPMATDRHG